MRTKLMAVARLIGLGALGVTALTQRADACEMPPESLQSRCAPPWPTLSRLTIASARQRVRHRLAHVAQGKWRGFGPFGAARVGTWCAN